jgi:hypothetical protein
MPAAMADERIEKWTRWIDGPIKGVITMYHHRQIWRGLTRVIEENGTLPPSAFWQHYFDVYPETQASAVRRQADVSRGVASLAKLLHGGWRGPEALDFRVVARSVDLHGRGGPRICAAPMG